MPHGRLPSILAGLWVLLLIPSVPLFGHECHGFVGFLAHSPLYAFMALTPVVGALGLVALSRGAGGRP